MKTRTPLQVSQSVLALCNKIVPKQQPIYLDVASPSWARLSDCFVNVEQKTKTNGGRVQYGWQIWEWPLVMLEAEFHAVWVSPTGTLIDITPKPDSIQRVLFLPDPTRKYQGQQVNSIRIPLQEHPLIDEYMEICNRIFAEQNRGDLANFHGNVPFSNGLFKRRMYLETHLRKLMPGRNTPCICGSGLKYKQCCGK